MDPMETLVSFLSELRYEDLPASAVKTVRDLTIDAVACGLAGSSAPLNPEIVERHARWGGAAESTVLVFGHRLPAPTAAWLNAALIHSHDFDDAHSTASQHVFVTLFPAVLAAGESRGAPLPGRALLAALAGAAELQVRIGVSLREHIHPGWLPTSVFGCLGAAAGCAKIQGLDGEGIANAAGFGYAQAHGNRQALQDGTLAKRLTPAFSARAGVHAAALAEIGATGPRNIVQGANGFFALFGGGKGEPSRLTDGLGERFQFELSGFKAYPCCRSTHRNIGAALEAAEILGPFGAQDIESIDLGLTSRPHALVGNPFVIRKNPQVDAQFSGQWTTAFTLLHGAPGLRDFEPEKVVDAREVNALAEKIRVHKIETEDPLKKSAHLVVRLKDGRAADVTHDKVKGDPEFPMSPAERRRKFFSCAENAALPLEEEAVRSAYEQLERIEEIEDVRPLFARLAAQPAKAG